MAKRIPKTFIDDLINRTDIVSLIGSRISFAKKTGSNHMACCPFHNEKTPSFCVSETKQFYYCFGCQASGDALRFLMEYDHLTFVEAVASLAAYNGMDVPYEDDGRLLDTEEKVYLEQGTACLEAAARFYQKCFYEKNGQMAREYLRSRALKKTMIDHYQIGYAPLHNQLLETLGKDYPLDLLQATGLIGEKEGHYYDWFRDRVMFPIRNIRGQVIAFGARAMGDAQPKYLNSSESNWFNKRQELYGLDLAVHSAHKSLIVTEGYMDVVKMAQFGLDNAVAALGTAFGEMHLLQLKKRTKKIYFCFDGDAAGFSAAEKALKVLFAQYDESYDWRFVFMPEGEDPDSLLTSYGKNAFYQCLDASLTPSKFLEKILKLGEKNSWNVEKQASTAQSAAQWLTLLPESNYRAFLQQELQKYFSVAIDVINETVKPELISNTLQKTPRQYAIAPQKLEWRLVAILLTYPQWHTYLSGAEISRVLGERMPVLHDFCYLLRCGANNELLQIVLQDTGLKEGIDRAAALLNTVSEQDLKKEFNDAIARQVAIVHEKRARLEKLGG